MQQLNWIVDRTTSGLCAIAVPTDPSAPARVVRGLNELVLEKVHAGRLIRLDVVISGSPFTTYAADGVSFAGVETNTNQLGADGSYQPLETPTAEQQQLMQTYGGPPYTSQAGVSGLFRICSGEM